MGKIIPKLRKSAKGQNCTMQIPGVCNHNSETVVLCHCPSSEKGMGNKSSDYWAAYGCSSCHEAMDNFRVENADQIWLKAIHATWMNWVDRGLIILPAQAQSKKRTDKVCTAYTGPKGRMQSRPFPKRGAA